MTIATLIVGALAFVGGFALGSASQANHDAKRANAKEPRT